MKKIQGLLLGGTLALVVASTALLLSFEKEPVKASADMVPGFYIGDHEMENNVPYEDGHGGTALYVQAQNKITLTNFHFEGQGHKFTDDEEESYAAFYYDIIDQNLTIELVGDNYFKETSTSKQQSFGMLLLDSENYSTFSTITIQGSGSLTAESSNNDAKYTYGFYSGSPKLQIKSGNITAIANRSTDGDSYGAYIECLNMSGGNLTAKSLGAKENSYGLYSYNWVSEETFVVSGGNITCLAGDTTDSGCKSVGLLIQGYKVGDCAKITGGNIYAEAGKNSTHSIGIYAGNNTKLSFDGGKVEAIGINNNASKEGTGILYYAYTPSSYTYVKSLMISNNTVGKFTGSTYAVGFTERVENPTQTGFISNSINGNGWDSIDKTGEPTPIPVNAEATPCTFKALVFGATATYTQEPTAKTNLTYTGEAQALVNAGASEEGTVVYRLGDSGEFSTSIPTGTDVGTYTVQYKILGDDSHIDSEIKSVEVDIANKPAPGPTPDPSSPSTKAGLSGGAIAVIVIASILILLGGAWALMMFVFNKWIKIGDKAVRAFKLFGLKNKEGKYIVWGFPFKFVTREEAEIFKTKEEASK